jgi:8-oxo-dGTP diphosphatase
VRQEITEPGSEHEVSAAGGVVVKEGEREPLIAVIHRPKYGDWTLPKGKLETNEAWEQAALREVREETGFECELVRELDAVRYRDRKGRSKLVRYWLMTPRGGSFEPNDEVDELRWLTPAEADDILSYEHDRRLTRSAEEGRTNV